MEGPNFILRIKEQETCLTLQEHDDDDDLHNLHITPFEANDLILCTPLMQTRWDPNVCIASCDLTNQNRPEDD